MFHDKMGCFFSIKRKFRRSSTFEFPEFHMISVAFQEPQLELHPTFILVV